MKRVADGVLLAAPARAMPTLRLFSALALVASLAACDSTTAVEPPPVNPPAPLADATYRVTFDATWSATTHPDAFPPNPHFSRLTGAAHADGVSLWSVGETASGGVEVMAETGGTATLRREVEALGDVADYVEGGPVRTSPGTAEVALTVTDDRPLATVVAMIAPSPDWFVGTDGLDLREGDGWSDRVVVPLSVFDAGTDDGASYTAANAPLAAPMPVVAVQYAPLTGSTVGTLTFERVADE